MFLFAPSLRGGITDEAIQSLLFCWIASCRASLAVRNDAYRGATNLAFLFIVFLTACSPKIQELGYAEDASLDWKTAIVVGQTSKQEVLAKFGSPSTRSDFGAETWYYISARKEGVGFMKPKVVKDEITDIQFDANGVVSAVNFYNKDDAQQIAIVTRTTPTEGHSLSFIDQTLGNLGRFNKPTEDSGISNSHGR